MAGTSELRCEGFIETSEFERSKEELKRTANLTDRQIDQRLDGLLWALRRDSTAVAHRVENRNLWVAAIPRGIPPLRIYLRPRADVPTECELLWIEEQF
jgi:hypothetical protein